MFGTPVCHLQGNKWACIEGPPCMKHYVSVFTFYFSIPLTTLGDILCPLSNRWRCCYSIVCPQNSSLQTWHVHTSDVKDQRGLAKWWHPSTGTGRAWALVCPWTCTRTLGPKHQVSSKQHLKALQVKNSFSKGFCSVKQLKMTCLKETMICIKLLFLFFFNMPDRQQ